MLCEVCGLDRAELAWVLDVAPDTADELATSATHRYRQALDTALACTETRVSKPVADVYGALGVAPLRDVLGRLPWPPPPPSLHSHFAPQIPPGRTAAPMFVKPLWPGPPTWPQPLAGGCGDQHRDLPDGTADAAVAVPRAGTRGAHGTDAQTPRPVWTRLRS